MQTTDESAEVQPNTSYEENMARLLERKKRIEEEKEKQQQVKKMQD